MLLLLRLLQHWRWRKLEPARQWRRTCLFLLGSDRCLPVQDDPFP
jgi:hypothetical protein